MEQIELYLKRDDWYLWANMKKGTTVLPVFQSLEAFWPGMQVDEIHNWSKLKNCNLFLKKRENPHKTACKKWRKVRLEFIHMKASCLLNTCTLPSV